MSESVPSESNERTVNNTMRHSYRILTHAEKEQMLRVKDLGADFEAILHQINGTAAAFENGLKPKLNSRELALAQTKIEEAVMWAVKHITG